MNSEQRASADRDAYEGAREDLLEWKGRAQRAEARLRALGWQGEDASEQPASAAGVEGSQDIVANWVRAGCNAAEVAAALHVTEVQAETMVWEARQRMAEQ